MSRRRWRPVHGSRWPGLLIAGLSIIVLAVVAAVSLREKDPVPQRATADGAPPGTVRAARLSLELPDGWRQLARASAVPGLPFRRTLAVAEDVLGLRAVAGILPATSRTLLPKALVSRKRSTPVAQRSELRNGLTALQYPGLIVGGAGEIFDVYAIPTSGGILTIACGADPIAAQSLSACRSVVTAMSAPGLQPFSVTADVAFKVRLLNEARSLDRARLTARRALSTAKDQEERVSATERLEAAYARSARALRPLTDDRMKRPRAVIAAMDAASVAYRSLADGVQSRDAQVVSESRDAAVRAEEQLRDLIREIRAAPR